MTFRPVSIVGCGMMTGVGLTAEASCAAIRARIDGFKETRFTGPDGEWIIGCEAPLAQRSAGMRKLARLLAGPLRECLDQLDGMAPAQVPVLLCVAEDDRPGRLEGLGNPLFFETCELLGVRFHPSSSVFPTGRVAGAAALHRASRLIHEDRAQCVIVAGVDTLLVADTLRHYGEQDRLLTASAMNGFIPGEAGAALIVAADGRTDGLECRGIGFAIETATFASEEPLRADGLTAAIRDALAMADVRLGTLDYRIADINGEQRAFKEAALAEGRLLREHKESFDLLHPADCIGDVGAAALPCMLCAALYASRKRYAPGPRLLVHLANDDGRRAALVLRDLGGAG